METLNLANNLKINSHGNLAHSQQNLRQLSDQALLEKTEKLCQHERRVTVLVLRHLREIEIRRLFVDLGYSSMYEYCLKHLKYSEGQTQRRLSAARLMVELPQVESKLQTGEMNVTSLSKIQSFVRSEKRAEHSLNTQEKLDLIEDLKNTSTRQMEKELIKRSHQPELLAEKFHRPDVLSELSPSQASGESYTKFEAYLNLETQSLLQEFKNLYAHELSDQSNVLVIKFLLEKAVMFKKKKLGMSAKDFMKPGLGQESIQTHGQKLEQESTLTHSLKLGKVEEVLQTHGLKKELSLNKIQEVQNLQSSVVLSDNAPLSPAAEVVQKACSSLPKPLRTSLKKRVWQRAQGCCEYRDPQTHTRCESRYALEVDHIQPVALQGQNEFQNLQLLCRNHNARRAVQSFGVRRI